MVSNSKMLMTMAMQDRAAPAKILLSSGADPNALVSFRCHDLDAGVDDGVDDRDLVTSDQSSIVMSEMMMGVREGLK